MWGVQDCPQILALHKLVHQHEKVAEWNASHA